MTTTLKTAIAAGLTLTFAFGGKNPVQAADKSVLSLRAFAVDVGGPGPARTDTVDIVFERWSTDAERNLLRDALLEKGSDKLLSTLQEIKPRVGFIRSGSSIGWSIRYARMEKSDATGSTRIVFATDRPMSFWESVNRPRSADYEFTLGEIRIGADGKGEGKLVPRARITWKDETSTVEIENYATEPVRLTVRVDK